MSRSWMVLVVMAAAVASLMMTGCNRGGPSNVSAAPSPDEVRSAGGPVSGAEGPALPDALATPVRPVVATPIGSSATAEGHEGRIVFMRSAVHPVEGSEGLFDVSISVGVSYVGVSAVELTATAMDPRVRVESIVPGTLLGTDPVVAMLKTADEGRSGRLAFARRGASVRGNAEGEAAIVRVSAGTAEQAGLLSVSVVVADADFTLRGPVDATLDH